MIKTIVGEAEAIIITETEKEVQEGNSEDDKTFKIMLFLTIFVFDKFKEI